MNAMQVDRDNVRVFNSDDALLEFLSDYDRVDADWDCLDKEQKLRVRRLITQGAIDVDFRVLEGGHALRATIILAPIGWRMVLKRARGDAQ